MVQRRQTSINDHFTPSSHARPEPGSSQTVSSRRRASQSSHGYGCDSQSSDSEAIEDIQLSQAPIKTHHNRTIVDSDDEDSDESIEVLNVPGSFDIVSSPPKPPSPLANVAGSLKPAPKSRNHPQSTEVIRERVHSSNNNKQRPRRNIIVSDDDGSGLDSSPRIRAREASKVEGNGKPVKSQPSRSVRDEGRSSGSEDIDAFVKSSHWSARKGKSQQSCHSTSKKRKTSVRDPDDVDSAITDSEDDDDLRLDEPERFKTTSRLREKKETEYQRKLRKMRNARLGIVESTTETEGSASDQQLTDSGVVSVSDGSEDFIEDDGGEVQPNLLPHEFSLNAAQTPEYKFKVCFHYFVVLVIRGPGILPLCGEDADYLVPCLLDLRRLIAGYRDSRVRSQIWKPKLVRSLKRFPEFDARYLDMPHLGCDACNKSTLTSRYRVLLEGDPYDPETHEPLETDSEEERDRAKRRKVEANRRKRRGKRPSSSETSLSSSEEEFPTSFYMGSHCRARAGMYHTMSHWEDDLYYRVRGIYRDILRAKRLPVPSDSEATSSDDEDDDDEDERDARHSARAVRRAATESRLKSLRKGNLPREVEDVDDIIQWMDENGYQAKAFHWFNDMILASERLEHDKTTDD